MARHQSEAPAETGAVEPEVQPEAKGLSLVQEPVEELEDAERAPRTEVRPDGAIANFDVEAEQAALEVPREVGA